MKSITKFLLLVSILTLSCTNLKKLAYLNNLPKVNGEETFNMTIPDYKIQSRDILYISIKAMTSEGVITDFLAAGRLGLSGNNSQFESGQYLYGFDVNIDGYITVSAIGQIKVAGLTVEEARNAIQETVDKVYKNSTVECKLISFKYTVIGEVKSPGTYINYNNYLTIFEALGRAGGINDFGRRDNILVIRAIDKGTKTYKINLQDKKIISSEAYYLLPNDVIVIESDSKKIFNLNLPTYTFILTSITSIFTTTLLLINYLK